jgi:hypothetical protein
MKSNLILLGLLVSLTGFSQSTDSVLIKGQVLSKDKRPLPSATIRVSHTNKIVYSDETGQFKLWSPIEGILEFSCIAEPYKVSLSSIGAGKKDELLKFEFDLKQHNSKFKTKKLEGRTIKVNKATARVSDIVLAYYESDFERITYKYYDHYKGLNYKIIFMVGGQVMNENFTLKNLDFISLKNVVILKILDSNDRIIFMISTKAK